MPTRPSNSPLFATDTTLSSGPETGETTRLSPGAGVLAQGLAAGRLLPGRVLSYVLGTLGDWCKYIDEATSAMPALNWPERSSFANLSTVNSALAIATVPNFGGVTRAQVFVLGISKDVVRSPDDGSTWLLAGVLANASAVQPELASGLIDAVPALMTNGGVTSNFYTSINGTTWTLRTSGPTFVSGVPCYAESLNRWVSAGPAGLISYAPGTTAGMSLWTGSTVPGAWVTAAAGAGFKRVVWSGSLFVALPAFAYDKCLTSPDGITWTERALGSTQTWVGLAYSASEALWVAISDGGAISTSPSGVTWTLGPSSVNAVSTDLAVNGSLWVATTRSGDYGGIAYSIDRGATWANVSVGDHSLATSGWKRILFGDSRFIVAHMTGANTEVALSLRSI